jgi:hypothetical protein
VLADGEQNRHFAATKMNDRSSRSHVCFTVFLESRKRDGAASVRLSQLQLQLIALVM